MGAHSEVSPDLDGWMVAPGFVTANHKVALFFTISLNVANSFLS